MHCKQKGQGCTNKVNCTCLCDACSIEARKELVHLLTEVLKTMSALGKRQQELAKASVDQRKALLELVDRVGKVEKRLAAR